MDARDQYLSVSNDSVCYQSLCLQNRYTLSSCVHKDLLIEDIQIEDSTKLLTLSKSTESVRCMVSQGVSCKSSCKFDANLLHI